MLDNRIVGGFPVFLYILYNEKPFSALYKIHCWWRLMEGWNESLEEAVGVSFEEGLLGW